jgi:hypothetical protein
MAKLIEKGDIYFFYRNKIGLKKASGLDDIQRLYVVLAPDQDKSQRLLVVGKKRLPDIIPGKSKSTEREWLMVSTVSRSKSLGKALGPVQYNTKTEGKQRQSEAIPAGAGRYALVNKNGDSRLAYKLHKPKKTGKAQQALGIAGQASYVISVRNPDIQVKGFPDAKPRYPKHLKERFANERWLEIDDSQLLNYKNAQLVLIGAHKTIPLDEDYLKGGKPSLFKRLGLDKEKWPDEALSKGVFATVKEKLRSRASSGDRSKGGERGGRTAAASASGIAHALKGVNFPCNRKSLMEHAKQREAKQAVLDVLAEFPARKFTSMGDVQKTLGEVR